MLWEKWSIPGRREAGSMGLAGDVRDWVVEGKEEEACVEVEEVADEGGCVSASRCERRNMFDLPTVHGATATVEMAV